MQVFRAREAGQNPIASDATSVSRKVGVGVSRGVRGVARAPRLGARTRCSAPAGRALSLYRRSPQARATRRDPGGQRVSVVDEIVPSSRQLPHADSRYMLIMAIDVGRTRRGRDRRKCVRHSDKA